MDLKDLVLTCNTIMDIIEYQFKGATGYNLFVRFIWYNNELYIAKESMPFVYIYHSNIPDQPVYINYERKMCKYKECGHNLYPAVIDEAESIILSKRINSLKIKPKSNACTNAFAIETSTKHTLSHCVKQLLGNTAYKSILFNNPVKYEKSSKIKIFVSLAQLLKLNMLCVYCGKYVKHRHEVVLSHNYGHNANFSNNIKNDAIEFPLGTISSIQYLLEHHYLFSIIHTKCNNKHYENQDRFNAMLLHKEVKKLKLDIQCKINKRICTLTMPKSTDLDLLLSI